MQGGAFPSPALPGEYPLPMQAQGVAKEEKRRLRRMVQKAREGKATTQSVRTHYAGWRAHIARGNTRALLKSMDAYLNDLLRDFEKEETNNEH